MSKKRSGWPILSIAIVTQAVSAIAEFLVPVIGTKLQETLSNHLPIETRYILFNALNLNRASPFITLNQTHNASNPGTRCWLRSLNVYLDRPGNRVGVELTYRL